MIKSIEKFIAKVLASIGLTLAVITLIMTLIVIMFALIPITVCLILAAIVDPECNDVLGYFKKSDFNVKITKKENE